MGDDSDKLEQAPTNPLPAVETPVDDSSDYQTAPLPAATSADEMDYAKTAALPAISEDRTEPFGAELSMPGDETGFLDGAFVDAAAEAIPTQELPDDQTLIAAAEAAGLGLADDDITNVGAVSDDAIVRKVVLPHVPAPSLPPEPEPHRDVDATHLASVPKQPRVPLPDEQRPPPRGPVPLAQFRAGGDDDATPFVDDIEPPGQRVLWALIWSAAASTLWLMATYVLSVTNWVDPTQSFIVSVGAFLPITLVAAYIARPPYRRVRLDDVFELRRPVIIAGALLVVGALPWQVGIIRAELRDFSGESGTNVQAILADRSDYVANAECVRAAANYADPQIAAAMSAALASRPEVLAKCLGQIGEATGVSEYLSAAWSQELVDPATPSERGCSLAASLQTLERPAGELEPQFARCIIAGRPEVGSCCANALSAVRGRTPWAASTDTPESVPSQESAAALLALAFDAGLTPAQAELKKQSQFTGPEARRMAFVLSCAAVDGGAELGDIFAHAVPKDCRLDHAALPRDAKVWRWMCSNTLDGLVRRGRDPTSSLCRSARAATTRAASSVARVQVKDAVRVAARAR